MGELLLLSKAQLGVKLRARNLSESKKISTSNKYITLLLLHKEGINPRYLEPKYLKQEAVINKPRPIPPYQGVGPDFEFFNHLPFDALQKCLLPHLSQRDIFALASTCRRLYPLLRQRKIEKFRSIITNGLKKGKRRYGKDFLARKESIFLLELPDPHYSDCKFASSFTDNRKYFSFTMACELHTAIRRSGNYEKELERREAELKFERIHRNVCDQRLEIFINTMEEHGYKMSYNHHEVIEIYMLTINNKYLFLSLKLENSETFEISFPHDDYFYKFLVEGFCKDEWPVEYRFWNAYKSPFHSITICKNMEVYRNFESDHDYKKLVNDNLEKLSLFFSYDEIALEFVSLKRLSYEEFMVVFSHQEKKFSFKASKKSKLINLLEYPGEMNCKVPGGSTWKIQVLDSGVCLNRGNIESFIPANGSLYTENLEIESPKVSVFNDFLLKCRARDFIFLIDTFREIDIAKTVMKKENNSLNLYFECTDGFKSTVSIPRGKSISTYCLDEIPLDKWYGNCKIWEREFIPLIEIYPSFTASKVINFEDLNKDKIFNEFKSHGILPYYNENVCTEIVKIKVKDFKFYLYFKAGNIVKPLAIKLYENFSQYLIRPNFYRGVNILKKFVDKLFKEVTTVNGEKILVWKRGELVFAYYPEKNWPAVLKIQNEEPIAAEPPLKKTKIISYCEEHFAFDCDLH